MIFLFEGCVLDVDKQELTRDGDLVHVEPQVLAVLTYLVEHADRVVTKIELLDEVWGDRFVSESALTSRIKLARKACGDSGREQRIIKTVHSRGYRCVADVESSEHSAGRAAASSTARAPVTPPAPSTVGAATSPRDATSVVGRERELEVLQRALDDAAAGTRAAVFVCGGLGAGTSTLVAEFLERVDAPDDWIIARGQCIRTRGGAEPYFPLLDALAHLARSEPALVAATLEQVAPSWLAQMPQLIDDDVFDRLERRLLGATPTRMLREGSELFGELARHRPLIVVLEDLHQADDCTLDVLDLLLQRQEPARLLLVGTGRPESTEVASVIEPAAAAGHATIIELPPLDRDSLAALVRDRLDAATLPDELVAIIEARCGGTPLFAEEIVLSWLRTGRIEVVDGTVRPATTLDVLEAEIPTTLPPLIERELATVDADERALLEACAVAGPMFAAATTAAAIERSVMETEEALATVARRRGFIVATGAEPWPNGTVSATYSFTQDLFREVIYDRIAANRRAALHGRVGAALDAGLGPRASDLALTLADHFALAGDVLRAVRHRCVAGEQANARSAHSHAVDILTRALDDLAGLAASDERDRSELEVRMSLGPALVATNGWFDPSVSENYERALELCGDDTLGAEAAAARYGLATVSELRGQFERTEALLAPLLAHDAPGNLALEAHELVACSTFHQGKFDRSLQTAQAVLDSWDEDAYSVLMARIAEHPASSCSSWLSLDLWALGRSDESLALAVRAVELGEQNRYALSTAVQQRAMLHQLRHEAAACIEWADRCRQVGEDQNFPMRTIQADMYKGWALAVEGRTDDGVPLIDHGLTRFREAGATLNEAYYLGLYADAVLRAGDPQRAAHLVTEAMTVATSRTYFYEAELWRLRAAAATAAASDDAVASAREAIDEGLAVADRQGAVALALRLVADRYELEAEQGEPEPWLARLGELVAVYEGQQPVPDVARARAIVGG